MTMEDSAQAVKADYDDQDTTDQASLLPDEGIQAAMYGNLDALKSLVKSGWSVNTQDAEGKTALVISCYQGWYEGTSFLLANDADQMIADNKQRLPIHAATYDSKIRCLALLVQHMQPSQLNSSDYELMTVLHWAAYHGRPDHVRLLISKSVNMLAKDCDGKTSLHWAAQRGNDRCVEVLLREARGTNLVNIKDNSGKGAIHYAAAAGHCETIECLSQTVICNIHLGDPQDRQPLHWAAATDRAACVDLLLKLGADPNMHDVNTRNALYYAKAASNQECVAVLMTAMKALHMAKREKLKTLDALRRKSSVSARDKQNLMASPERKPKEDNSEQELHVNDSSHNTSNSNNTVSKEDSNNPSKAASNAKNKLPPIRGTIAKSNKVQTIDDIDETLPIRPETPSKVIVAKFKSAASAKTGETAKISASEVKPVNTAMTFVPTTRLYSQSGESD